MRKILVIEDNLDVRENIVEILELSGYQVYAAIDGPSGVKLAKGVIPDLVLCDIMMPGLDGYGVLYALGRDEQLATIPFIFLTAKTELDDRRKGMRMGADDYLTKPFDESDLLLSIENRITKNEKLQKNYSAEPAGLNELVTDAALSEDEVLQNNPRERYASGHNLYREGSLARSIFYFHSGTVKIYQEHPDGKELTTDIIKAGSFFGFIPVLLGEDHYTAATTLSESEITTIPVQQFDQLMANSDFRKRLMKLLSGNIKEREQEMLELAYGTVRKRVADGLIRIWEKAGQPDLLDVSREEVARVVGVATETLVRTLSDFRKEGLISVDRSGITVDQPEGLRGLKY